MSSALPPLNIFQPGVVSSGDQKVLVLLYTDPNNNCHACEAAVLAAP
jgi:hypothetical protein